MGQGRSRHPVWDEGKTIAPPSSNRKKIGIAGAAIAAGALLLQACGLPSNLPSLVAPFVPSGAASPSSSNTFTFDNGVQTTPSDFYGFEIYYKFYDDTSSGGGTQYQSDNTQLSSTTTGPSQLVSLGYRRAYLLPPGYQEGSQLTQATTPNIPITSAALKSTTFQVSIDFSNAFQSATGTNFYPEVDVAGSPLMVQFGAQTATAQLARYFAVSSNPFPSVGNYILEGFGQNDFAFDQGTDNGATPPGDIPATIADQTTVPSQALVLGLYAIAYGLVNFTTPIYSTPTALGYIHYYSASFASQSDPTP